MFQYFRRHQKAFIVVAGVILMFVFTVGDSVNSWLEGRGDGNSARAPGDTAVSWDGGQLTVQEFGHLLTRREILDHFVTGIAGTGYNLASREGLGHLPPRVQMVGLIQNPQTGARWTQRAVEADVVQTHILAAKARQQGVVISDETIKAYIGELGRGQLDGDSISAVVAASNPRGGAPNEQVIFDALREQLLAASTAWSATAPLSVEMPVDRWEGWRRANDHVVIEAAAVDPSTFVIDVPEPTESQLREYYETYKNRLSFPVNVSGVDLPQPTPGFGIPRRIRLQYLRANYNEFIDRYSKEITDEQIAEYYEQNKHRFTKAQDLDDFGDDDTKDDDTEQGDADEEKMSDSAESPKVESNEPEPGPENQPDTSTPESSEAPGKGNAFGSPASPFRLAAYQSDGEGTEPAEATEPAETSDSDPSASAEASEVAEPDFQPLEPEYQPLEEVKDDIRRLMAEDRFFNEIDETMTKIAERLNPLFERHLGARFDAEALDKEVPKPSPELADLSSLAAEFSLEYEQTGELNLLEMRESDVGKSHESQKYKEGAVPIWQVVFATDLEPYEPILSTDVGRFGDRYLVMKLTDDPARSPSFDEVKDQVTQAWKQAEAAQLALKRAEELAKEATQSELTLEEFFQGNEKVEVTRTPTFTFLTTGDIAPMSGAPNYRMSQPEGVKKVGPDFMKEVFRLKQGEVTAALNHDHSIAYVVRLADEFETTEELRSKFLEEANSWPGRGLFRNANRQQAQQAVLGEMVREWNVDYHAPEKEKDEDESDE